MNDHDSILDAGAEVEVRFFCSFLLAEEAFIPAPCHGLRRDWSFVHTAIHCGHPSGGVKADQFNPGSKRTERHYHVSSGLKQRGRMCCGSELVVLNVDQHRPTSTLSFTFLPALHSYLYSCFSLIGCMAYAIQSEDYAAPQDRSSPRRFNKLLTSVLGSPFVTTPDLPQDTFSAMRMLADDDLEAVDGAFHAVPRAETVTRPPSPTPSFSTDTYSIVNWTESMDPSLTWPRPSLSDAAPACSFLPGPSRRSSPQGYYTPTGYPQTPYNTVRSCSSSSFKGSKSFGILPRIWEVLRESSPGKKGKRRFDLSADLWNDFGGEGYIDYANLPPLDGEEGELIDDEACFIDVKSVTGLGEFSRFDHITELVTRV